MDRRNFLRMGLGAAVVGRASAVPIEPSPDRERCFAWLAEAERRSSEAMAMFHRPWRWVGLTAKIEETLVVTTRAWLLWRGLDATGESAHCIYEAARRADDVTGIPWNDARVALLELRSLRVDCTPYGDGWYRDPMRKRLHGLHRKALLAALRANDRCAAAVRAEFARGVGPVAG